MAITCLSMLQRYDNFCKYAIFDFFIRDFFCLNGDFLAFYVKKTLFFLFLTEKFGKYEKKFVSLQAELCMHSYMCGCGYNK